MKLISSDLLKTVGSSRDNKNMLKIRKSFIAESFRKLSRYLLKMKQKIVLPKRITSELAEETGLHIDDGSMNFYSRKGKSGGFYQLRAHLIDDREHYLKRILYLYKKIYNLDIKLREMISTGVFGFQIWSDLIVAFKHNVLGLPLGKKLM